MLNIIGFLRADARIPKQPVRNRNRPLRQILSTFILSISAILASRYSIYRVYDDNPSEERRKILKIRRDSKRNLNEPEYARWRETSWEDEIISRRDAGWKGEERRRNGKAEGIEISWCERILRIFKYVGKVKNCARGTKLVTRRSCFSGTFIIRSFNYALTNVKVVNYRCTARALKKKKKNPGRGTFRSRRNKPDRSNDLTNPFGFMTRATSPIFLIRLISKPEPITVVHFFFSNRYYDY